MRVMRLLAITASLVAACAGEGVTDSTLSDQTTTTVAPTTTTTIPPTTTTVPPTSTTSTLPDSDWDALTADIMHSWIRDDVPAPDWLVPALVSNCEEAVLGFSTMGQLLGEDVLRVADIAADVEDRVLPLSDGSAAFEEWGQTALPVSSFADETVKRMTDPQGILWVGKVGVAASSAGFSAVAIASLVFLEDSDELDQEALNTWLPGFNDATIELLDTSLLFEGEQVCTN